MAYNDSGRAPDEFPPAAGVRLPWSAVPPSLRAAVEATLGEPVVDAVTQSGGFSPGVAARLRGAGGRRAFVKALGPEPNPESRAYHRVEARVTAALPPDAPAPRLLDWYDRDEWVVLLFEDVDGVTPTLPWRPDELARVLAAVGDLAATLTPTPVAAPSVAERFDFRGWRRLAESAAGPAPGLDPWAARHLDLLAELESGWVPAAAGDTLVHADLRADNLLLTPDRVVVVDWPWACVGAPWFDLLAMLPSVAMQGGPLPNEIFDDHPVAAGADPAAVTAVVAALAGFFVHESLQPPLPGLPTLRDFQAAQGRTALDWLRTRLPLQRS
jgi:aminoglycoside phosphotransferase (APT) family kinase protein